jgi:NTE family protein
MEAYMKALCLSGGGVKGSWQVGVLTHLLGNIETKYDIICGVSVGAINCGFLAQYKHGQEKESIAKLQELWLQLINSKIYKPWKLWGRFAALWRPSFFDSQPLVDLLDKHIDLNKIRNTGKKVSVGAVNMSSGKYHIFHQDNDDFIKAIAASASFPGVLRPVKIGDHLWSDGGSKEITPLRTAIDLGATDIDVLTTSPEKRTKLFMEKPNTLDMFKRSIDLSADKIMSNDIEKAQLHNKLANHGIPGYQLISLNIIRPKYNLIEDFLDFDPHKIKEMMDIGYKDAIEQFAM